MESDPENISLGQISIKPAQSRTLKFKGTKNVLKRWWLEIHTPDLSWQVQGHAIKIYVSVQLKKMKLVEEHAWQVSSTFNCLLHVDKVG